MKVRNNPSVLIKKLVPETAAEGSTEEVGVGR